LLAIVTVSVPSIIAGIGLLRRQSWARVLSIVLSVIHLFNIPFGTALGVYGLRVMSNGEHSRSSDGCEAEAVSTDDQTLEREGLALLTFRSIPSGEKNLRLMRFQAQITRGTLGDFGIRRRWPKS